MVSERKEGGGEKEQRIGIRSEESEREGKREREEKMKRRGEETREKRGEEAGLGSQDGGQENEIISS